ncbi:phosphopantetheine-binding protein [Nocardia sienata]|uniref:phosphopantetheine-binding protein n=1 Tax=Nocardia sienata TaxID=248552 RepID=UPI0007A503A2|nr:phosphopantetheine-binding protein [Nocardia sienata]
MDPVAGETADTLIDRIAMTWCHVLGVDEVGHQQNFFDLGGTSFQLLLVKNKLDTDLGVTTELVSFFRYPTVTDLATNVYGGTK